MAQGGREGRDLAATTQIKYRNVDSNASGRVRARDACSPTLTFPPVDARNSNRLRNWENVHTELAGIRGEKTWTNVRPKAELDVPRIGRRTMSMQGDRERDNWILSEWDFCVFRDYCVGLPYTIRDSLIDYSVLNL